MYLEKVTDLSYAEKTLLGKYRLCSEQEKAEIRAQIQDLLKKTNSLTHRTICRTRNPMRKVRFSGHSCFLRFVKRVKKEYTVYTIKSARGTSPLTAQQPARVLPLREQDAPA